MASRTPSQQGALYVGTQVAAGTFRAPVQASDTAVGGLVSQPHPSVAPGKVEQSEETSPYGGGGFSVTDTLRWDWPVVIRASGVDEKSGAIAHDMLPLLRCCALDEDAPVISGGLAVRFRPTVSYGIAGSTPQTGVPKVASCTWIDGGGGDAVVFKGRDAVGRLASIAPSNGGVAMSFELMPLWYRDAGDIDSSRISRSGSGFTMAAVSMPNRANHPFFNTTGWTLAIDGGSTNAAELVATACVETFDFQPNMSLDEQICLQEVDGFDPAFSVQAGPAALALTITQTLGTTLTSPFSAMLRDLTGASVVLRKTIEYGGIVWGQQIVINNFEVYSSADGDSNGKRTEVVTLRGFTINASSRAWELQFDREVIV